jgi:KDO2-lipid IV(A) lauroyltransferase
VEFFGHFALAHDGLSRLALLAKAPIFSMALLRRKSQPGEPSWGGYRYEIRLLDPVEPFDANGKRRSPEDVTRELANKMEELIRREPSQWMWFHDRWRVSGGSRQGQAQGRGRLGR